MSIGGFLEHAAECALAGEKTDRWPRRWRVVVDYMALTWPEDDEDFESPEHECLGLCLAAAIARDDAP